MSQQGEQSIIDGILNDAAAEARKITDEATQYAKSRKEAADKEAAAILAKAEKDRDESVSRIERVEKSALLIETHRLELSLKEDITAHVLARTKKEFEFLLRQKEKYIHILGDWLAEAAIGLDESEAFVSTHPSERAFLTDELLRAAEKKASQVTGKTYHLSVSKESEIRQGIFLKSKNGRLGYSNQVETRMSRRDSEIRDLIRNRLFEDGDKAS